MKTDGIDADCRHRQIFSARVEEVHGEYRAAWRCYTVTVPLVHAHRRRNDDVPLSAKRRSVARVNTHLPDTPATASTVHGMQLSVSCRRPAVCAMSS